MESHESHHCSNQIDPAKLQSLKPIFSLLNRPSLQNMKESAENAFRRIIPEVNKILGKPQSLLNTASLLYPLTKHPLFCFSIFHDCVKHYNISMKFIQKFKKLIYQFDLFCSSQLLRYNQDTQYKTLTGGLLSLAIITVIIVGFASMISQTLNRSTIISSFTTIKQSDPPLTILVPNKENMFMMGFSIQSINLSFLANLSATPKFFDVHLRIIQIENGNLTSQIIVDVEQCTKEHWNMMPSFNEGFDSFGISSWLCLPLNYPLTMQGTYSSPTNFQVLIQVTSCNNQTSNNTCASQQQISALFAEHGNFYLTINYINSVINPNQQQPVSYYIEANDYVIFSDKIGSQAWVYFSDFKMQTDNSIWPYTEVTTRKGYIVESKAINHPYTIGLGTPYASVFLAKSVNSLIYTRQVQKISAVFSYIGGLVGAITAILFLIKTYTDISLEITIGLHLFQSEEKKKEDDESGANQFNFYGFICLTAFRALKLMGWQGEWKLSSRLEMYQNEAVKQLDVQILLKRIIKLQTCMTKLFTNDQLEQIRVEQFISLQRAQKMRSLLLKNKDSEVKTSKQMRELDSCQKDAVNGEVLIDGNSEVQSNMQMIKGANFSDNVPQKTNKVSKFRQDIYPAHQIDASNERDMAEHVAKQKLFGLLADKPNRRQLPAIFAKNTIQPE